MTGVRTRCRSNALINKAIEGQMWDNGSEAARCVNTVRPLTHLIDLTDRQDEMKATQSAHALASAATNGKRGLEPAPHAPTGLTPDLMSAYEAWLPRFRSKVRVTENCWEWLASTTPYGYGRFGRGGRGEGWTVAHRWAYEATCGPIPEGLVLDHLCRNPLCVRPDHVEPVTHPENVRRGASGNAAGWCRSGRHEWIPANIVLESGRVKRCRPCRDERERRRVRGIRVAA